MPEIDYLIITHDHWDHLDYKTVVALSSQIKKVITGLGTGSHLEYWGFRKESIIEKDWYEQEILDSGFVITATPCRHFSGRLFSRNQSLWVSFALRTPTMNIYINGDSGYDTHFADIGKSYGPFDIALMECGQYNKNWRFIHQMPEQVVQSVIDLRANRFIPGHWGKFTLAPHAWDDPIKRVVDEAECRNVNCMTPMVGEEVDLNKDTIVFEKWWR